MKILAVNGRTYEIERLREALRDARTSRKALELLVENGEFTRTYQINYHDGERYPHLERDSSHCIDMSASRWRITWLAASGRPNCWRTLVYSSVLSSMICMIPTASAPSAAIARSTVDSIAQSASLLSPSSVS